MHASPDESPLQASYVSREKGTAPPPEHKDAQGGLVVEGGLADDGTIPTAHEMETLPRVSDQIPLAIFMVVAAEAAERFTYRSITGPVQNYVQNPLGDRRLPGALGKGQPTATAIGYFFQCWCYLTPIMGAYIADSYLGRFKTIFLGTLIATIGTLILFLTALPISLEHGVGFPGLMVALFVIGIGAGGIKSNVGPLVAEQYAGKRLSVITNATGRRVILDPDVTVQAIFSRYYWIMNIGSCSGLIATWVERKVGFWATFLIALCRLPLKPIHRARAARGTMEP